MPPPPVRELIDLSDQLKFEIGYLNSKSSEGGSEKDFAPTLSRSVAMYVYSSSNVTARPQKRIRDTGGAAAQGQASAFVSLGVARRQWCGAREKSAIKIREIADEIVHSYVPSR